MTGPSARIFDDVLVLTRRDGGWVCDFGGRPVWIGELQIEPGTLVPLPGTRGSVTIAAFAVEALLQQLRPRSA
jgi:hypothetical protein